MGLVASQRGPRGSRGVGAPGDLGSPSQASLSGGLGPDGWMRRSITFYILSLLNWEFFLYVLLLWLGVEVELFHLEYHVSIVDG
ncbi:MAG: hypothetical protein F7B20_06515 [Aeropyrum sp.]|nr:hypothetical protein [Aeropyrum sp.]